MTNVQLPDFKVYYYEPLYMNANVETGVLMNRSGRRMIALTDDFILGLHRAITKECGERAFEVLYHCGKRWGKNFANALHSAWSEFYEQPANMFPAALFESLLVQEFAHNGWGRLALSYEHGNCGIIEVALDGAIMGDMVRDDVAYPTDTLTAGILAGMFTRFMERELAAVQTQVWSEVMPQSRFVLVDHALLEDVRSLVKSGLNHDDLVARLVGSVFA